MWVSRRTAELVTTSGLLCTPARAPATKGQWGYRGSLSQDHPHYLALEQGTDLYLNLVDPRTPLFMPSSFNSFLAFSQVQLNEDRKILIHCNQGESRAPSLALLLLAKLVGSIPNDSYRAARAAFEALFNGYNPGMGIRNYLADHWSEFDNG